MHQSLLLLKYILCNHDIAYRLLLTWLIMFLASLIYKLFKYYYNYYAICIHVLCIIVHYS